MGENTQSSSPAHLDGRTPRAELLLRISPAAYLLGIGRTTLYKLIEAGDIRVVRIGRAVRIPVAELHAFVDQRRNEAVR